MTKKILKNKAREILYKYKENEVLIGDDFYFITDLLKSHPEKEKKIGCGIRDITVKVCKEYRTKHFQIIRIDGSEIDFSFLMCITNTNTPHYNFRRACRSVIKEDIIIFKKDYFLSHKELSERDYHVDHAYPFSFERIVQDFIKENKIDIKNIKYSGDIMVFFADKYLGEKFKDYHNNLAVLEILSKEDNLTKSKLYVNNITTI